MGDGVEVTSKNVGALLVEGLEEAVAVEEGRARPARVRRLALTVREVRIAPPPRYDAERIVGIRRKLDMSQPVFASMLNVSSGTVKAWEQGVRTPEGPTRRLLEVAERDPAAIAEVLSSANAGGTPSTKGTGSGGRRTRYRKETQ